MVLALFVIFFSALFLVWQGTLSLEIGFGLMAVSISAIIWRRLQILQTRRRIRREVKERRAKWGGILTVVSGLSSFTGTPCHLFITRNDELVVEDLAGARIIPLSEVERIGLFFGQTLEKQSDRHLMRSLKFPSVPHFSNVRAWVARNPRARKRLILAIRFGQPLNELEYSEMAVFCDLDNVGNMRAFALRPEIAVKIMILGRRSAATRKDRENIDAASREADYKPLPWELSHHLAGKPIRQDTVEILPLPVNRDKE